MWNFTNNQVQFEISLSLPLVYQPIGSFLLFGQCFERTTECHNHFHSLFSNNTLRDWKSSFLPLAFELLLCTLTGMSPRCWYCSQASANTACQVLPLPLMDTLNLLSIHKHMLKTLHRPPAPPSMWPSSVGNTSPHYDPTVAIKHDVGSVKWFVHWGSWRPVLSLPSIRIAHLTQGPAAPGTGATANLAPLICRLLCHSRWRTPLSHMVHRLATAHGGRGINCLCVCVCVARRQRHVAWACNWQHSIMVLLHLTGALRKCFSWPPGKTFSTRLKIQRK